MKATTLEDIMQKEAMPAAVALTPSAKAGIGTLVNLIAIGTLYATVFKTLAELYEAQAFWPMGVLLGLLLVLDIAVLVVIEKSEEPWVGWYFANLMLVACLAIGTAAVSALTASWIGTAFALAAWAGRIWGGRYRGLALEAMHAEAKNAQVMSRGAASRNN